MYICISPLTEVSGSSLHRCVVVKCGDSSADAGVIRFRRLSVHSFTVFGGNGHHWAMYEVGCLCCFADQTRSVSSIRRLKVVLGSL